LVNTGGPSPVLNAPLKASNCTLYPSTTGFAQYKDLAFATNHLLEDIQNHTAFTAMYDAYKINYITLRIENLNNVAVNNGAGLMTTVYLAWDQDSSVTPATVTDLTGIQGVQVRQFGSQNNNIKLKFRPNVATANQNSGGVNTAAMVQKSPWIDCAHTNINHFATKCWMTDLFLLANPNCTTGYRLNWTYNVSFRSPIIAS